jgi:hypothetical protein
MMPRNTRRRTTSVIKSSIVFSLLLSSSCLSEGDGSAGSPEPPVWSVGFEPVTTIGKVEGEAEYLFSRIGPAALLPGGRIVVADLDEAAIRLFAEDGSFETAFGRRGEGPGEFSYISRIQFTPPDTIVVHDSRLYRLAKFLPSGSLVSTLQLQAEDGFPEVFMGEFSSGELGYAWILQGNRGDGRITPDQMQIGRFGEDGRLSSLLGTEEGMRRAGSPLAFSPHLHTGLIGDSVFLTNGRLPEIEVWDRDGALVRTIHVPVPEVDPEDAWRALEEVVRARGNDLALGLLETQPREEAIPWISMMLVDDQDRLWVKGYDPSTDSHYLMDERCRGGEWWIMDPDGTVIATIHLPDGFLLLDIRENRLLGKTRDPLGVEQIRVYPFVPSDSRAG